MAFARRRQGGVLRGVSELVAGGAHDLPVVVDVAGGRVAPSWRNAQVCHLAPLPQERVEVARDETHADNLRPVVDGAREAESAAGQVAEIDGRVDPISSSRRDRGQYTYRHQRGALRLNRAMGTSLVAVTELSCAGRREEGQRRRLYVEDEAYASSRML